MMEKLAGLVILCSVAVCVSSAIRRQIFGHHFPDNPFAGHHSGGSFNGGSSVGYHPCVPTHSICSLTCSQGYVKGPNGCDFCVCRTVQEPTGSGLNHVTQPTSPRAFAGSATAYQPCIPSQIYCSLTCTGGYTKGPAGCDFCMCAPTLNHGTVDHSTYGPALVDPASTLKVQTARVSTGMHQTTSGSAQLYVTKSSTVQPTTTLQPTDACTIAKSNCVLACGSGGFLTDPTDCTVCVCKSSILG